MVGDSEQRFFHSIVTAKYTAYLHTEKDTGERSETTYWLSQNLIPQLEPLDHLMTLINVYYHINQNTISRLQAESFWLTDRTVFDS